MNKIIFLSIVSIMFLGCSSKEQLIQQSDQKEILLFSVVEDPHAGVVINHEQSKIYLTLTNPSLINQSLTPQIELSAQAAVSPASGEKQIFSDSHHPIIYTVTAQDGSTRIYTVELILIGSNAKSILRMSFSDLYQEAQIDGTTISFMVPYGTRLDSVVPTLEISTGATVVPGNKVAANFSTPIQYTVTAENGTDTTYTVSVKLQGQETAVRAVWIPDPAHTTALSTYQNLQKTIELLDELNFNTIYVASWARVATSFKSQVLLANTNYTTVEEGYFFNGKLSFYNFPVTSPTSDPIRDLITEAHKRNIKVVLWFEYGFMAAANAVPTVSNNPILAKHPDWAGIGNDGRVSNYNNSDYYLNAYNPEVQQFLLDLIEEALTLYPDVDGIQGDDRMPAMPRNSGYDTYTVDKYKQERGGQAPPNNYSHPDWVRWRLNILNQFGVDLHTLVKRINPKAAMCFSPNPYPWSEDNLMQEWPKWIATGIVDILSVQCYRDNLASYEATVKQALGYVKANTSANILNPGMILKSGSTIMNEQLLVGQLRANRSLGTNGESQFFNEGLKDKTVQKVFKAFYPGKAINPLDN